MSILEGVTVALLTPIDRDGKVDHPAVGRLVSRVLEAGVSGISPLGSTGEGFSLALDQRLAVIETVAGAVPAGTPVTAGVFAHNPGQAIDEIAAYSERGATAALVAPPTYYPLSSGEQRLFFSTVAAASVLPIVMYNIPVYTKVQLDPRTVADLAAHPQVVGLKDSGRDFGYLSDLLDALSSSGVGYDSFEVVTGTDAMLVASLIAGARGTICASANLVPELPVGIVSAVRANELELAGRLEARLRRVLAACRIGGPPAGIKTAVAAAGVCEPWLVSPRSGLGEPETAALVAALRELAVLPAATATT